MISLDICNGSFSAADDLSTKVPSKTKYVNVKVFNKITRIHDAKTLTKHNSCDCKCNFNSIT